MLLCRNLAYWLLVLFITPVCLVLLIAALPLSRRRRHIFGVMWARILLWGLERLVGLNYRVIGLENILPTPSIICSKHQSAWETLALQQIFPAQIYVAKRELIWIPLFGWGLAAMNPITINRRQRMRAIQQILEQGRERLRHGFWIVMFPEGTRITPGKRSRYKLGAAWLAQELDLPLLPVAHNAGEFWPRNAFLKYPGVITVVIGPAIYPLQDGRTPEELMAAVEVWIEARQREIGGVGPHAHPDERKLLC